MSILDVQRRYRELGRLRMGEQRKTKDGKSYPAKLDTWRLTSPSADLLARASEVWGGTVEVWDEAPTQGEQFELTTEAARLEVYVPPQDLERSQYMELWKAGGVERRCDLFTELISGKDCMCDPDNRACTVTTHLQVILPQIPDVGVWRMTTRGWNAATELPATVDMLRKVHAEGAIPAAVLEIEQRTKKAGGETRHFVVPILRLPYSILEAHQRGLSLLPSGKPPLPTDRPQLPADASFAGEAQWGAPPELPGAGDVTTPPLDESPPAPESSSDNQEAPASEDQAQPEGSPSPEPSGDGHDPNGPATPTQFERLNGLYDSKVSLLKAAGAKKLADITFAKAEALILEKAGVK